MTKGDYINLVNWIISRKNVVHVIDLMYLLQYELVEDKNYFSIWDKNILIILITFLKKLFTLFKILSIDKVENPLFFIDITDVLKSNMYTLWS